MLAPDQDTPSTSKELLANPAPEANTVEEPIPHPEEEQQADSQQMYLADILRSMSVWDNSASSAAAGPSTSSSETSSSTEHPFSIPTRAVRGSVDCTSTSDLYSALTPAPSPAMSLSPSPSTSAGTSSRYRTKCSWCAELPAGRCADCNERMCADCIAIHRRNSISAGHTIVAVTNVSPPIIHSNILCDSHKEIYRFVCETCKRLVCQYCTLREHPDHHYIDIAIYVEGASEKMQAILDSSIMGTKYVKGSIDTALSVSRSIERDMCDVSQTIRKSFRQIIICAEERERQLLEQADRMRQRKQTQLADQTAGLRSALAGLSQNSDMISKAMDTLVQMDPIEVAQTLVRGQSHLEQFALIYQDLQPRPIHYTYFPPSSNIGNDVRTQGDILMTCGKTSPAQGPFAPMEPGCFGFVFREAVPNPSPTFERPGSSGVASTSSTHTNNSPGPVVRIGQCILGSYEKVTARKALIPSRTFAHDGHEDGQVSRPWGMCVDKEGHILISDRRNNRVQVFHPDGSFKFKFGAKGAANGQFDLPAGICVDCDNRIIVVDKDNHRVQVFTSQGRFMLKFGCFGREYGQFQYPWDVAANSRRQIFVTDSRNHRVQQFDSEGRFIKHLVLDHYNGCKSIPSPRGICITPNGEIIISDFDNHGLLLLDSDLTTVIAARGQEGTGIQEFNRPSGVCCDDDGNIIVADSKNQRVVVFTDSLEYLWTIEIRPSMHPHLPSTLDEKDRPCDVAVLPNGRVVILIELSPDCRDTSNPMKRFVQVY